MQKLITHTPQREFVRKERKITRNLVADVCDYCDLLYTSQMVNIMDSIGCTNAMADHSTGKVSMLDLECYYGTIKKGSDIPVYFYGGALQQGDGSSHFEMIEGTASDWVADSILYQMSQDIETAWGLFRWLKD